MPPYFFGCLGQFMQQLMARTVKIMAFDMRTSTLTASRELGVILGEALQLDASHHTVVHCFIGKLISQ